MLSLFDAAVDRIEHSDSDLNHVRVIGDYRPAAWFRTFFNLPPVTDVDRSAADR